MALQKHLGEPLWDQIRRRLLADIRAGRLRPGDQLPTERELAVELGVSLAPVRAALSDLARAGLIERTAGRGTFVSEQPDPVAVGLLRSTTDSLKATGVSFTVTVVESAPAVPDVVTASLLGLAAGEQPYLLRRVVTVSGRPAIVLTSWLHPSISELVAPTGYFTGGGSLYALLAGGGFDIHATDATLGVARADDQQARLLDVDFATPILEISSVVRRDDDSVVEIDSALYDTSKVALTLPMLPPARRRRAN